MNVENLKRATHIAALIKDCERDADWLKRIPAINSEKFGPTARQAELLSIQVHSVSLEQETTAFCEAALRKIDARIGELKAEAATL